MSGPTSNAPGSETPADQSSDAKRKELQKSSGSYGTVLRIPGAAAFTSAGILARMPLQGGALAITLAVVLQGGSYALAGLLVAMLTIGRAISAPVLSRLVDLRGQAAVMTFGVLGQFLSLGALTFGVLYDWHLAWLIIFSAMTGLTNGAPHAYVRARWVNVTDNRKQLDTAFAWESMIESFGVALTPLILVLLINTIAPIAGLAFLAVITIVGGIALYSQKRTEPAVVRSESGRSVPIGGRRMRRILMFASYNFCGSFAMGAISILGVQQEEATGIAGYSGFALTSFALGTLVAAFLYGLVNWQLPPDLRLRAIMPFLALTVLALPLIENSPLFLVTAFAIGFPFIGILTSSNRAVQEVAPQGRLTELLAWLAFAQATGIAVGNLLVGIAIDGYDYVVAALATTLIGAFGMIVLGFDSIVYRKSKRVDLAA